MSGKGSLHSDLTGTQNVRFVARIYGMDTDALVEYVAASRVLYEFMENGVSTGTVADGAESYYLLGLTQYRIERSAWLPQAELFLEKAIRTAPASPSARSALELLQAKIDQSFAAQGTAVPVEVVRHLQMLREMVESKG